MMDENSIKLLLEKYNNEMIAQMKEMKDQMKESEKSIKAVFNSHVEFRELYSSTFHHLNIFV